MATLTIDGQEVDMGDNIIAITKQAYTFEGLQDRYISYSNRVNLPRTNKNNDIFKRAKWISTSYNSFHVVRNVVYNDDSLIFRGVGVLNSVGSAYQFQVIENSKEFFNNLNESVRRLSLDQYDFTFNSSEYDNLKNDSDSVWIWAVSSMHEIRSTAKTPITGNLQFSRPFFNVSNLINLIFQDAGWELSNSNTVQNATIDLCISSNHEDFFVSSWQKTFNDSFSVSTSYTLPDLDVNDFSHDVLFPDSETVTIQSKSKFRLRGTITTDSNITISIDGDRVANDQTQTFSILTGTTEVDLTTNDFDTKDGNFDVQIIIYGDANVSLADLKIYTLISEEDISFNPTNYLVKTHDNLIDISKIDFLKSIWGLFSAYFQTDSFVKKINTFSTSELSKLNSLDWSGKFIENTDTQSADIRGYGKSNYLRYSNDDTLQTIDGQGSILSNSEVLPDESVIYESYYSASKDTDLSGFSMADLNIYSDTERINDLSPRILKYYIPSGESYSVANFSQLDFSILVQNYFNTLSNSIISIKVVECLIDLNPLDVSQLDFKKTIYIDYFKSYFWCLGVESYIKNKPTKVKFLKFG